MRTCHLGCSVTSVSATVPESKSSEPPLEFSTCAMAVRVNAARSSLRLPVSLKSCSVTLGNNGVGEFAPVSAGKSTRAHKAKAVRCLALLSTQVRKSRNAKDFPPLLLTKEGGEGRGEEAISSRFPSLRLSPHSFLTGREGTCVATIEC